MVASNSEKELLEFNGVPGTMRGEDGICGLLFQILSVRGSNTIPIESAQTTTSVIAV